MTIMHITTIANGGSGPWIPNVSQFRQHFAIPWDQGEHIITDPKQLRAMFVLATHAQGGSTEKMQGRIFDILRVLVGIEMLFGSPENRPSGLQGDSGPYCVVTSSDVYHRMEFEKYANEMGPLEWKAGRDLALSIYNAIRASEINQARLIGQV